MIIAKQYLDVLIALLLGKATNNKTTSYKEIGTVLDLPVESGRHQAVGISFLLDIVSQWYITRGELDLTSLVVRDSGHYAGTPGNGFWIRRGLRHTSEEERTELTKRYHAEIYTAYQGLDGHDAAFARAMTQVDERKSARLALFKSTIEPLFIDFTRRWCPSMPDSEIRQRITYSVNQSFNQNKAMLLFPGQFALCVRDAESDTRHLGEIKKIHENPIQTTVGFSGFDRHNPPFDHERATKCWLDTMSAFGFLVSVRAKPTAYAIRNEGMALDCTLCPRANGLLFYVAVTAAVTA